MTRGRSTATILCTVWLALAAAQAIRLIVTGSLMSGDGVYHFAHLHSMVVDRDLDPVNEIRYFREVARSPYTGQPKIGDTPPRHPATGEVVNKYPIGLPLLVLPAYVTTYIVAHLLSIVGVNADLTGYGWTYQFATSLLVAAYATFGLWCCQRVSSWRDASPRDGWWATLLAAGATPWLFYATLEPLFSHALSASVAAALVWRWLRARERGDLTAWFFTGALAGLATMVRYQDAVLILVPILDLAVAAHRGLRAAGVRVIAVTLGVLAAACPQLAINYRLYGNPLTTGYFGEDFAYLDSPRIGYALWSADVGWIRWSPLVAAALVGLAIAASHGRPQARMGLVLIGVQIYLVSSWYFVSQGHSFGNRMLVGCTVFVATGVAGLLTSVQGRHWLRTGMLGFGVVLVGLNLLLMGLWSRGAIGPLRSLMP